MSKVDVGIIVEYNFMEPEKTVLKTNMNPEGVEEILEAWLRGQMGQGADTRPRVEKEAYTIKIGVDLSDDTIFTQSDAGNDGLTCGIIGDVFLRRAQLRREPLP